MMRPGRTSQPPQRQTHLSQFFGPAPSSRSLSSRRSCFSHALLSDAADAGAESGLAAADEDVAASKACSDIAVTKSCAPAGVADRCVAGVAQASDAPADAAQHREGSIDEFFVEDDSTGNAAEEGLHAEEAITGRAGRDSKISAGRKQRAGRDGVTPASAARGEEGAAEKAPDVLRGRASEDVKEKEKSRPAITLAAADSAIEVTAAGGKRVLACGSCVASGSSRVSSEAAATVSYQVRDSDNTSAAASSFAASEGKEEAEQPRVCMKRKRNAKDSEEALVREASNIARIVFPGSKKKEEAPNEEQQHDRKKQKPKQQHLPCLTTQQQEQQQRYRQQLQDRQQQHEQQRHSETLQREAEEERQKQQEAQVHRHSEHQKHQEPSCRGQQYTETHHQLFDAERKGGKEKIEIYKQEKEQEHLQEPLLLGAEAPAKAATAACTSALHDLEMKKRDAQQHELRANTHISYKLSERITPTTPAAPSRFAAVRGPSLSAAEAAAVVVQPAALADRAARAAITLNTLSGEEEEAEHVQQAKQTHAEADAVEAGTAATTVRTTDADAVNGEAGSIYPSDMMAAPVESSACSQRCAAAATATASISTAAEKVLPAGATATAAAAAPDTHTEELFSTPKNEISKRNPAAGRTKEETKTRRRQKRRRIRHVAAPVQRQSSLCFVAVTRASSVRLVLQQKKTEEQLPSATPQASSEKAYAKGAKSTDEVMYTSSGNSSSSSRSWGRHNECSSKSQGSSHDNDSSGNSSNSSCRGSRRSSMICSSKEHKRSSSSNSTYDSGSNSNNKNRVMKVQDMLRSVKEVYMKKKKEQEHPASHRVLRLQKQKRKSQQEWQQQQQQHQKGELQRKQSSSTVGIEKQEQRQTEQQRGRVQQQHALEKQEREQRGGKKQEQQQAIKSRQEQQQQQQMSEESPGMPSVGEQNHSTRQLHIQRNERMVWLQQREQQEQNRMQHLIRLNYDWLDELQQREEHPFREEEEMSEKEEESGFGNCCCFPKKEEPYASTPAAATSTAARPLTATAEVAEKWEETEPAAAAALKRRQLIAGRSFFVAARAAAGSFRAQGKDHNAPAGPTAAKATSPATAEARTGALPAAASASEASESREGLLTAHEENGFAADIQLTGKSEATGKVRRAAGQLFATRAVTANRCRCSDISRTMAAAVVASRLEHNTSLSVQRAERKETGSCSSFSSKDQGKSRKLQHIEELQRPSAHLTTDRRQVTAAATAAVAAVVEKDVSSQGCTTTADAVATAATAAACSKGEETAAITSRDPWSPLSAAAASPCTCECQTAGGSAATGSAATGSATWTTAAAAGGGIEATGAAAADFAATDPSHPAGAAAACGAAACGAAAPAGAAAACGAATRGAVPGSATTEAAAGGGGGADGDGGGAAAAAGSATAKSAVKGHAAAQNLRAECGVQVCTQTFESSAAYALKKCRWQQQWSDYLTSTRRGMRLLQHVKKEDVKAALLRLSNWSSSSSNNAAAAALEGTPFSRRGYDKREPRVFVTEGRFTFLTRRALLAILKEAEVAATTVMRQATCCLLGAATDFWYNGVEQQQQEQPLTEDGCLWEKHEQQQLVLCEQDNKQQQMQQKIKPIQEQEQVLQYKQQPSVEPGHEQQRLCEAKKQEIQHWGQLPEAAPAAEIPADQMQEGQAATLTEANKDEDISGCTSVQMQQQLDIFTTTARSNERRKVVADAIPSQHKDQQYSFQKEAQKYVMEEEEKQQQDRIWRRSVGELPMAAAKVSVQTIQAEKQQPETQAQSQLSATSLKAQQDCMNHPAAAVCTFASTAAASPTAYASIDSPSCVSDTLASASAPSAPAGPAFANAALADCNVAASAPVAVASAPAVSAPAACAPNASPPVLATPPLSISTASGPATIPSPARSAASASLVYLPVTSAFVASGSAVSTSSTSATSPFTACAPLAGPLPAPCPAAASTSARTATDTPQHGREVGHVQAQKEDRHVSSFFDKNASNRQVAVACRGLPCVAINETQLLEAIGVPLQRAVKRFDPISDRCGLPVNIVVEHVLLQQQRQFSHNKQHLLQHHQFQPHTLQQRQYQVKDMPLQKQYQPQQVRPERQRLCEGGRQLSRKHLLCREKQQQFEKWQSYAEKQHFPEGPDVISEVVSRDQADQASESRSRVTRNDIQRNHAVAAVAASRRSSNEGNSVSCCCSCGSNNTCGSCGGEWSSEVACGDAACSALLEKTIAAGRKGFVLSSSTCCSLCTIGGAAASDDHAACSSPDSTPNVADKLEFVEEASTEGCASQEDISSRTRQKRQAVSACCGNRCASQIQSPLQEKHALITANETIGLNASPSRVPNTSHPTVSSTLSKPSDMCLVAKGKDCDTEACISLSTADNISLSGASCLSLASSPSPPILHQEQSSLFFPVLWLPHLTELWTTAFQATCVSELAGHDEAALQLYALLQQAYSANPLYRRLQQRATSDSTSKTHTYSDAGTPYRAAPSSSSSRAAAAAAASSATDAASSATAAAASPATAAASRAVTATCSDCGVPSLVCDDILPASAPEVSRASAAPGRACAAASRSSAAAAAAAATPAALSLPGGLASEIAAVCSCCCQRQSFAADVSHQAWKKRAVGENPDAATAATGAAEAVWNTRAFPMLEATSAACGQAITRGSAAAAAPAASPRPEMDASTTLTVSVASQDTYSRNHIEKRTAGLSSWRRAPVATEKEHLSRNKEQEVAARPVKISGASMSRTHAASARAHLPGARGSAQDPETVAVATSCVGDNLRPPSAERKKRTAMRAAYERDIARGNQFLVKKSATTGASCASMNREKITATPAFSQENSTRMKKKRVRLILLSAPPHCWAERLVELVCCACRLAVVKETKLREEKRIEGMFLSRECCTGKVVDSPATQPPTQSQSQADKSAQQHVQEHQQWHHGWWQKMKQKQQDLPRQRMQFPNAKKQRQRDKKKQLQGHRVQGQLIGWATAFKSDKQPQQCNSLSQSSAISAAIRKTEAEKRKQSHHKLGNVQTHSAVVKRTETRQAWRKTRSLCELQKRHRKDEEDLYCSSFSSGLSAPLPAPASSADASSDKPSSVPSPLCGNSLSTPLYHPPLCSSSSRLSHFCEGKKEATASSSSRSTSAALLSLPAVSLYDWWKLTKAEQRRLLHRGETKRCVWEAPVICLARWKDGDTEAAAREALHVSIEEALRSSASSSDVLGKGRSGGLNTRSNNRMEGQEQNSSCGKKKQQQQADRHRRKKYVSSDRSSGGKGTPWRRTSSTSSSSSDEGQESTSRWRRKAVYVIELKAPSRDALMQRVLAVARAAICAPIDRMCVELLFAASHTYNSETLEGAGLAGGTSQCSSLAAILHTLHVVTRTHVHSGLLHAAHSQAVAFKRELLDHQVYDCTGDENGSSAVSSFSKSSQVKQGVKSTRLLGPGLRQKQPKVQDVYGRLQVQQLNKERHEQKQEKKEKMWEELHKARAKTALEARGNETEFEIFAEEDVGQRRKPRDHQTQQERRHHQPGGHRLQGAQIQLGKDDIYEQDRDKQDNYSCSGDSASTAEGKLYELNPVYCLPPFSPGSKDVSLRRDQLVRFLRSFVLPPLERPLPLLFLLAELPLFAIWQLQQQETAATPSLLEAFGTRNATASDSLEACLHAFDLLHEKFVYCTLPRGRSSVQIATNETLAAVAARQGHVELLLAAFSVTGSVAKIENAYTACLCNGKKGTNDDSQQSVTGAASGCGISGTAAVAHCFPCAGEVAGGGRSAKARRSANDNDITADGSVSLDASAALVPRVLPINMVAQLTESAAEFVGELTLGGVALLQHGLGKSYPTPPLAFSLEAAQHQKDIAEMAQQLRLHTRRRLERAAEACMKVVEVKRTFEQVAATYEIELLTVAEKKRRISFTCCGLAETDQKMPARDVTSREGTAAVGERTKPRPRTAVSLNTKDDLHRATGRGLCAAEQVVALNRDKGTSCAGLMLNRQSKIDTLAGTPEKASTDVLCEKMLRMGGNDVNKDASGVLGTFQGKCTASSVDKELKEIRACTALEHSSSLPAEQSKQMLLATLQEPVKSECRTQNWRAACTLHPEGGSFEAGKRNEEMQQPLTERDTHQNSKKHKDRISLWLQRHSPGCHDEFKGEGEQKRILQQRDTKDYRVHTTDCEERVVAEAVVDSFAKRDIRAVNWAGLLSPGTMVAHESHLRRVFLEKLQHAEKEIAKCKRGIKGGKRVNKSCLTVDGAHTLLKLLGSLRDMQPDYLEAVRKRN